jgi:hypothetical protein
MTDTLTTKTYYETPGSVEYRLAAAFKALASRFLFACSVDVRETLAGEISVLVSGDLLPPDKGDVHDTYSMQYTVYWDRSDARQFRFQSTFNKLYYDNPSYIDRALHEATRGFLAGLGGV